MKGSDLLGKVDLTDEEFEEFIRLTKINLENEERALRQNKKSLFDLEKIQHIYRVFGNVPDEPGKYGPVYVAVGAITEEDIVFTRGEPMQHQFFNKHYPVIGSYTLVDADGKDEWEKQAFIVRNPTHYYPAGLGPIHVIKTVRRTGDFFGLA